MLATSFDRMLERLERAFARQRDFVSDASHELRTPLAVLRAQVELLDRESDPRRRHDGSVTLLRRLDEMDRLVDDMLTLASAEAGRLVQPRPIDLYDFFEDVRRDLPLFGERDFHSNRCRDLEADPDRLTQVLRNLVRNAVAHTTRADAWRSSPGARRAADDRGQRRRAGHPAEQLERVFERFHRVTKDARASAAAPGSGCIARRSSKPRRRSGRVGAGKS